MNTASQTELQLDAVDAHVFQRYWSFLPNAADALDAIGEFVRARTAFLGYTASAR